MTPGHISQTLRIRDALSFGIVRHEQVHGFERILDSVSSTASRSDPRDPHGPHGPRDAQTGQAVVRRLAHEEGRRAFEPRLQHRAALGARRQTRSQRLVERRLVARKDGRAARRARDLERAPVRVRDGRRVEERHHRVGGKEWCSQIVHIVRCVLVPVQGAASGGVVRKADLCVSVWQERRKGVEVVVA